MPGRELLTAAQRFELLDLTMSVRQHRGDHERLGVAVLMIYLRYPAA
jgi:hypothetical protein